MPFPNHREGFQASDQGIYNGLDSKTGRRISSLTVRSVNPIYLKIRVRLAEFCEDQNPLRREIEIDESYSGPKRVRGKRGRGAGHKTIVFGILKRGERVYAQIVPDARKHTLLKAIHGNMDIQSIIHSDGRLAYDDLVDVGCAKHLRVNHARMCLPTVAHISTE